MEDIIAYIEAPPEIVAYIETEPAIKAIIDPVQYQIKPDVYPDLLTLYNLAKI